MEWWWWGGGGGANEMMNLLIRLNSLGIIVAVKN